MPLAHFHVRSIAHTTSHRTLGPVNAGSWDPEIPGSLDLLQSRSGSSRHQIWKQHHGRRSQSTPSDWSPSRCVFGLARDNVGKSYFQSVPFPSNSPTLRQSVTEKSGSHTPPPHLWAWVVPEHPAGAAREGHLNLFWWVVDLKSVWCLLWLPVLVLVHCAHTINAGMALHYLVYTCSLPWTLVDMYPTALGCAVRPGRCCGLCCEGLRVCHVPLNIPRRAEGPDGPVNHCARGALGSTATNPLQSRRVCEGTREQPRNHVSTLYDTACTPQCECAARSRYRGGGHQ